MVSLSRMVRHGGFLLIPAVLVLDGVICWLLHKFAGRLLLIAWAGAVILALGLVVVVSQFMITFTMIHFGDSSAMGQTTFLI